MNKGCCACGESKPQTEFGKRTSSGDGLYSSCKACRKVERAAYYAANRERVLAGNAAWREANPDKVIAGVTAWKHANSDKVSAYRRLNYERNRSKVLEQTRAWQKANPDRFAEICKRRRARIAKASIGTVDLVLLWESQDGLCGLCGDPIDADLKFPDPMSKSVDHIVPLSKGGAHEQSNLQWTHLVENQQKGASVPDNRKESTW